VTPRSGSIAGWRCHRPFIAVVSFYAIGLLLAEFFRPPLAILFASSFLILFLALTIGKCRALLLCALLILTGWTNLVFRTAIISPNDLRLLIGDKTETAAVRGVLVRTPQIRISERRGNEVEHSQAQVRVSEIRIDESWQPANGDVIVTTPIGAPARTTASAQAMVAPAQAGGGGQAVEISGIITRPPPAMAEGLFDYRAYLQTRGIFYELRTRSTNDWQLREPILSRPPLTDRFLEWSRRVMALGLPEDQTLRPLWAMTLGWRTAFTGDVGDPFLRAGTIVHFVFK
jgi:hypothetical protein